jgi:CBS-domain-containing membrane protein
MSPRAAWRLESLGFTDVYEYSAGKSDWGAYSLPLEGEVTKVARIKDLAHSDVATCGLDDTVATARERAEPWKTCFVVNAQGVVLGRMFGQTFDAEPHARVGDVMSAGPSTFRPDVSAVEMLEYMDRNDLETAPVTTPDGKLVGLVVRADVERAAGRKG